MEYPGKRTAGVQDSKQGSKQGGGLDHKPLQAARRAGRSPAGLDFA
jgi:hypothetical protein